MDESFSALLYTQTRKYIQDQIEQFGYGGLSRGFGLVIASATVLLTIWFVFQGWLIATGQSRDSMRGFITRSVQVVLVMAVAQGAALFGKDLIDSIDGLKNMISLYITGDQYKNPEGMIDAALLAMTTLQGVLDVYAQNANSNAMSNGLNFITGMGQAVPSLVAGGLLLLNQIALSMCLVFAPLFIICFLFEVTKPFFQTWVKFTITTLFSLAVLTVIITIAMKAILVVSATILAADAFSQSTLKLREIATVQGGLGMMMTTLILGGPPLVTNFFSGQVAAVFSGYNQIGANTGGKPAGGPQDLANKGLGGNTLKNRQSEDEPASSAPAPEAFASKALYGGGTSSAHSGNVPPHLQNAS